jgi:hypothetical protein
MTNETAEKITLEKYIEIRRELHHIWKKECGKRRAEDGK